MNVVTLRRGRSQLSLSLSRRGETRKKSRRERVAHMRRTMLFRQREQRKTRQIKKAAENIAVRQTLISVGQLPGERLLRAGAAASFLENEDPCSATTQLNGTVKKWASALFVSRRSFSARGEFYERQSTNKKRSLRTLGKRPGGDAKKIYTGEGTIEPSDLADCQQNGPLRYIFILVRLSSPCFYFTCARFFASSSAPAPAAGADNLYLGWLL